MSSARFLAITIIIGLCAVSICGCISSDDLQASIVGYTSENPDHVDIRGSNLALRNAANALESGNRTAFMEMVNYQHEGLGGDVVDFDFSSPEAAALAQGMISARVTGSSGQVWRGVTKQITVEGETRTLYGDIIYDRVEYKANVNGETYVITMVNEMDRGWKLAEMRSDNDTFVSAW